MDAFIAMQNYIVKQEKVCGVGVSVTQVEEIAQYESSRLKNVQSYNNWMLINIPASSFFLDIEKPIKEQTDDVLNVLMKKDFILSLFIHEARQLYDKLDDLLLNSNDKKNDTDKYFSEFATDKYESLIKIPSGQELFNFINKKCVTHDKAKSSSLLYKYGIKGCKYKDETGERFLLFNAKKDIEPIEYRSAILKDSKLIM